MEGESPSSPSSNRIVPSSLVVKTPSESSHSYARNGDPLQDYPAEDENETQVNDVSGHCHFNNVNEVVYHTKITIYLKIFSLHYFTLKHSIKLLIFHVITSFWFQIYSVDNHYDNMDVDVSYYEELFLVRWAKCHFDKNNLK